MLTFWKWNERNNSQILNKAPVVMAKVREFYDEDDDNKINDHLHQYWYNSI